MKPSFGSLTVSAGAGAIFAVGLVLSGMTQPSKVVGFLDVTGAWDASLALVMVGAICVHFIAYRWIRTRSTPLFDSAFHLPTNKDLDPSLVAGAALFGVGWGLGGFCPGPALVTAAGGGVSAIVFVLGMTLGMFFEHAFFRVVRPPQHDAPTRS